eukprot:gene3808-2694_t
MVSVQIIYSNFFPIEAVPIVYVIDLYPPPLSLYLLFRLMHFLFVIYIYMSSYYIYIILKKKGLIESSKLCGIEISRARGPRAKVWSHTMGEEDFTAAPPGASRKWEQLVPPPVPVTRGPAHRKNGNSQPPRRPPSRGRLHTPAPPEPASGSGAALQHSPTNRSSIVFDEVRSTNSTFHFEVEPGTAGNSTVHFESEHRERAQQAEGGTSTYPPADPRGGEDARVVEIGSGEGAPAQSIQFQFEDDAGGRSALPGVGASPEPGAGSVRSHTQAPPTPVAYSRYNDPFASHRSSIIMDQPAARAESSAFPSNAGAGGAAPASRSSSVVQRPPQQQGVDPFEEEGYPAPARKEQERSRSKSARPWQANMRDPAKAKKQKRSDDDEWKRFMAQANQPASPPLVLSAMTKTAMEVYAGGAATEEGLSVPNDPPLQVLLREVQQCCDMASQNHTFTELQRVMMDNERHISKSNLYVGLESRQKSLLNAELFRLRDAYIRKWRTDLTGEELVFQYRGPPPYHGDVAAAKQKRELPKALAPVLRGGAPLRSHPVLPPPPSSSGDAESTRKKHRRGTPDAAGKPSNTANKYTEKEWEAERLDVMDEIKIWKAKNNELRHHVHRGTNIKNLYSLLPVSSHGPLDRGGSRNVAATAPDPDGVDRMAELRLELSRQNAQCREAAKRLESMESTCARRYLLAEHELENAKKEQEKVKNELLDVLEELKAAVRQLERCGEADQPQAEPGTERRKLARAKGSIRRGQELLACNACFLYFDLPTGVLFGCVSAQVNPFLLVFFLFLLIIYLFVWGLCLFLNSGATVSRKITSYLFIYIFFRSRILLSLLLVLQFLDFY